MKVLIPEYFLFRLVIQHLQVRLLPVPEHIPAARLSETTGVQTGLILLPVAHYSHHYHRLHRIFVMRPVDKFLPEAFSCHYHKQIPYPDLPWHLRFAHSNEKLQYSYHQSAQS